SIEIVPQNPTVQRIGSKQQVRVLARFSDGKVRDVTAETFLESGNTDVVETDSAALITTIRRGEAPILARYEGKYAATTLTVMGNRDGFVWQPPPANNFIDELVAGKLQRMKILSSDLCSDAVFFRRVYLDLTGLPPSADDVTKFLADKRDTRIKRDELIDRLVGNDAFIDHWTNKWADLLLVNRKFLGTEGSKTFRDWIRKEVAANTPYDEFARKIVTASGSNKENPAASYFKITRTAVDTMENTTQLLLAIRFSCNKCHDHPFERWTQDQYYQTAAWFAQFGLKKDPASGKKEIGKTAVERGKPLYEIVFDKTEGDIKHDRTGQLTPPEFPYEVKFEAPKDATRRQRLAAWITSPHNQYFASSYVNRLWGYLLGLGLIEPLDDIRAGNPPTNPELLDGLTKEFVDSGFDSRHMLRTICKSRTYQLSLKTNQWNADDQINYSHALARRLPAEVLYDAVHAVTGSQTRPPGVPPGTRAAQFPDAGVKLADGFLAKLGRPARETSCECERSSGMQLGPIMALVSGPTIGNAISDAKNDLVKLANSKLKDNELINEIFLRFLSRPATPAEVNAGVALIQTLPEDYKRLVAVLQEYEKKLKPIFAQREKQRQIRIETTSADLVSYEKEIAPREVELNRKQKEQTAKLETVLKDYEKTLPGKIAAWEVKQKTAYVWHVLDAIELSATNNAKLEKQPDQSIFVSGKNGKGTYKFVARTDQKAITGVRLELLADKRLPSKGPGRAPNGNFVLTEFRVEAAPEANPDQKKKVVLQNAQADFSQQGYDVKTAIDNKQAPVNNGWASSPKLGVNRTAVFETKENVGTDGGTLLTFWLDQKLQDGKHTIGRFRISITTTARPVRLGGLPQNIVKILAMPADKRNGKQNAQLLKYFRGIDGELKKRQQAVAASKNPRPIDPKLVNLRKLVEYAKRPLPADATLEQLKKDVQQTAKDLENPRLTAAQDLAWALINSPAYLFNR
ncbi:MAG: DUF1553 domain-containing protein, partial [Planctomycetes bacterium]|nr:DUF1553 domain-containing protein [Planctomycetota bacterium]